MSAMQAGETRTSWDEDWGAWCTSQDHCCLLASAESAWDACDRAVPCAMMPVRAALDVCHAGCRVQDNLGRGRGGLVHQPGSLLVYWPVLSLHGMPVTALYPAL